MGRGSIPRPFFNLKVMPFFNFQNPTPSPPWHWACEVEPPIDVIIWVRLAYVWAPPVKAVYKGIEADQGYLIYPIDTYYPHHAIAKWKLIEP